jgi:hypothetical protein
MDSKRKPLPSICVTVDYELFADGTGDIQTHILRPTETLLRYCEEVGIRVTFFVEVAELIAFEEASRRGKCSETLKDDYDAIRVQLKKIVQSGHDIQLHLHPQWIQAAWRDGNWQLPTLHASPLAVDTDELVQILRRGKKQLETIGLEASSTYNCHVFRAGSLQFDRAEQLTNILLDIGVQADSSVCRGYARHTPYANIDYRDLTSIRQPYWETVTGNVADRVSGTLIEIPVWGNIEHQWHKLNLLRLWNKFGRGKKGYSTSGSLEMAGINLTPRGAISWLIDKQPTIWDFCLMSSKQLIGSFKAAIDFHLIESFFPLVMLGHTKELLTLNSLEGFRKFVMQHYNADWITMTEAVKHIKKLSRLSNTKGLADRHKWI